MGGAVRQGPTDAAAPRRAGAASLSVRGAVAEVALGNGPLNLVTKDLLRSLNGVVTELARREDVLCVIVHGGEARAFCAGSDMRDFSEIYRDASDRKILFEDMVLRKLARLPAPTIAAIDGPALGGGLEIALCCDLRVLRADTHVALPECRIGGLAGNGAVRLARLIGPARAKEMLFTGVAVASDQALAWGLVNRVASDGSALDEARLLADEIARRGPISNRLAKELVETALDGSLDGALTRSTVAQQTIFESEDLLEGADAFFAKRTAVFKGR
jgi:enoyl-CoA hydratase